MQAPYPKSDVIHGIRWLGAPLLYPESHGDTWAATWADDGNLYAVADDTLGVRQACRSNLAIHCISGVPPHHTVQTINAMPEYLGLGEVEWLDMWKGNGLICVDGVLYLSVSQHTAEDLHLDNVQRAHSASLVKSPDHGRTWSPKPSPREAMFPGHRFATPFFVQFGRDYQGAFDEFEDYVHAVSSGGVWNNGNYMILGRVRRDLIGRLDAADWEFFAGTDSSGRASWSSKVIKAHAIFRHRGHTSQAAMQYVPAIRRFILGQWAYTDLDAAQPWDHTALTLYEAPRPWGPWRLFHCDPDWAGACYNPGFPAKWFEEGGRRMWLTFAGNWTNAFHERKDIPFGYGLIVQALELRL
ncbi:MAG: hypothetical protein QME94_16140 [Anaerolineae bacterium]|nr:hypothetical protein [Anaerolineae bacterium]